MRFEKPLLPGRLIRRYKRFLADVELASGEVITAHTANTGSMSGCATPGARVYLSDSENPARKYPYTWELVEGDTGTLVHINTARPNHLVTEAISNGTLSELRGYPRLVTERQLIRGWRSDLMLQGHPLHADCLVEVKNVTLRDNEGIARFPDARSDRASRQGEAMIELVTRGFRVVVVYCVSREDCVALGTADSIDPHYAAVMRRARQGGVEVLAYRASVNVFEVKLVESIPVMMSAPTG